MCQRANVMCQRANVMCQCVSLQSQSSLAECSLLYMNDPHSISFRVGSVWVDLVPNLMVMDLMDLMDLMT